MHEFTHQTVGDLQTASRIDEAEQHKMAEQDASLTIKSPQQPSPIQLFGSCMQQMVRCPPVVPLTFHDKSFGPNHFFGGHQSDSFPIMIVAVGAASNHF